MVDGSTSLEVAIEIVVPAPKSNGLYKMEKPSFSPEVLKTDD